MYRIAIGIFGLLLGAVIGFVLPLVGCLLIDTIQQPDPGNGWMAVGWIFWIYTIPLFAVIGCIVAIKKNIE